ncbi:MAG: hypothetical protein ABEL97_09480 [Salinibacter sp.]
MRRLDFPLARLSVLLVVCLVVGMEAQAQAPTSCDSSYVTARKAYYAADFETAAEVLRECLERTGVSDSLRVRMYRLLAFVHLGRNDSKAARLAVESLLDLRPDYAPDPDRDRPDYVALVRKAKASSQTAAAAEEDENGRRWVRWGLGSLGAAAVGTAAVLLIGGDGGDGGTERLPRPAAPPE